MILALLFLILLFCFPLVYGIIKSNPGLFACQTPKVSLRRLSDPCQSRPQSHTHHYDPETSSRHWIFRAAKTRAGKLSVWAPTGLGKDEDKKETIDPFKPEGSKLRDTVSTTAQIDLYVWDEEDGAYTSLLRDPVRLTDQTAAGAHDFSHLLAPVVYEKGSPVVAVLESKQPILVTLTEV